MADYSKERLDQIWEKGHVVRGKDPDRYRKDDNGNLMYKGSYGKYSEMGWNVDHKVAQANGGSDNLRNLRPLNSRDNLNGGNTIAKMSKCLHLAGLAVKIAT